jgi:protein-tyrosine-phosphatase
MTDGTVLTPEQHHQVREATERLRREFAGVFSAETVERCVEESRLVLERHARIGSWLHIFIERFARDRLRAAARAEGKLVTDKPAVLFLCVHNAGRSQMAAGWLRRLAGDAVDVFSGGSDPGSEVNPAAATAMAEMGIDLGEAFPKPWTDEMVRAADVVVTMGCGDACPVLPGKRYLDWEVDDPAGQPLEIVRVIRDDIRDRVRSLLEVLGVEPAA